MNLSELITYGALVAVALYCAAHVPKEQRGAAKIAGALFLANWLLYISAWSGQIGMDISPWWMLNKVAGIKASDSAIWAFTDALTATLIVASCYQFWWGFALWALYTFQVSQHYTKSEGLGDFASYTYSLDLSFVVIVSIFMLIGGKGAWDHVRIAGDMHVRWLCSVRGAGGYARKAAEEVNGS